MQALCSAVGLSCGATHSEALGTVETEGASFLSPPVQPGWLSHGTSRGLGGLLGPPEPASLIDVLVATPGRCGGRRERLPCRYIHPREQPHRLRIASRMPPRPRRSLPPAPLASNRQARGSAHPDTRVHPRALAVPSR